MTFPLTIQVFINNLGLPVILFSPVFYLCAELTDQLCVRGAIGVVAANVLTDWADNNQLDSSGCGSHDVLLNIDGHNSLDGLNGDICLFCYISIGEVCKVFDITHILTPVLQVHASGWDSSADFSEPGAG